jgi:hypothetical protein
VKIKRFNGWIFRTEVYNYGDSIYKKTTFVGIMFIQIKEYRKLTITDESKLIDNFMLKATNINKVIGNDSV